MPKLRRPPPMRLLAWTAFWVFLLDQASKWLVVHWLDLRTQGEIEVLPPILKFQMAWNQGVNFGLLAAFDMRWALVALAVGISGFVVWWVHREGGGKLVHVSAGLLVGGAIGNVVDRLLYGKVADFLNFPFFGESLAWGLERLHGLWDDTSTLSADRIVPQYSLNFADIAIFVGALGLVLFAGRGPKRQSRRARPAKTG